VLIAPTQIKRNLSVGNVYDLTLVDFYSKARKFAGINVHTPFLWNINGEPLVKQMREYGFELNPENVAQYTSEKIKRAEEVMKQHYLDFDCSLRDDQIQEQLEKLARTSYQETFNIGNTNINECITCGNIFGSDPSISSCRSCGRDTTYHQRETMFKNINREDIERKIAGIEFFPSGAKKRLEDFIDNLPSEYDLILEKNREFTTSIYGFKLDPRFVTMMFPALINKDREYDIRTSISGDVVKKFNYYTLCYLNQEDVPTRIVTHSILVGSDKKKLRWQNDDGNQSEMFNGVHNKVLRAYFLKHNIQGDLIIDPSQLFQQTKGLTRLYVQMGRTLEERNVDLSKTGIRDELNQELVRFNQSVVKFNLPNAFSCMNKYATKSWKMVKDDKLSIDEYNTLKLLRNMYFGE